MWPPRVPRGMPRVCRDAQQAKLATTGSGRGSACLEATRSPANLEANVVSVRVFLKETGHALAGGFEAFGTAEGNQDGCNAGRSRRDHGALGIAGGTAMRSSFVGEYRQTLKVEVVFADALVGFAAAPGAKDDVALHVGQIVEADGKAAFHGDEVNDVDDRVDLRKAFAIEEAPQECFGGSAITSGILAKSFVARARREYAGRFQHHTGLPEIEQFRFARLHLFEQQRRRLAGTDTGYEVSECGARALCFEGGVNGDGCHEEQE